jgi:hypothetical protein
MKQSQWPDGPYWLLMSVNGCPEPPEYGWEIGYIQFTANISEHETAFFHESQIESKVSGMFGPYTYRMNFCYKSNGQFESFDVWPNFYFSVFGKRDSCPGGEIFFLQFKGNFTLFQVIMTIQNVSSFDMRTFQLIFCNSMKKSDYNQLQITLRF